MAKVWRGKNGPQKLRRLKTTVMAKKKTINSDPCLLDYNAIVTALLSS